MKLICFFTLLACAMADAAPITFQSSEHPTALLEFYTSEGCSSCPPAEAWLSKLKTAPGLWSGFVPVAFHAAYPGPADDLKAHATDFLQDKDWPKDFLFVLDPDYSFTKSYGLRWDAPKETAHPSTFIISKEGKVTFAHVSKGHGDRVGSDTVLKALNAGMMKDDMTKPGM